MDWKDEPLLKELLKNNRELHLLWEAHVKFEKQLKKMERRPFLTPEEKIEKKRLQLAKLAGKTKIEEILAKHRSIRS
jgi:uncharacterized protein